MQLVYLSIQNIHELLQLALHVALLLSTVVYVDLQTSYPPLQLAVLRLCSLLVDENNKKNKLHNSKRWTQRHQIHLFCLRRL